MAFSRREYWSGLPFPSPGDLLDPGIKHRSPSLQADFLPTELPGKPIYIIYIYIHIHHIFFIYSFIDACLGSFHILAIISNATINIGVNVYFKLIFGFFEDIYTRVELLDHLVILILVFLETFMFSTVAAPFYHSHKLSTRVPSLSTLANICYSCSV